jgi:hypothetical protein
MLINCNVKVSEIVCKTCGKVKLGHLNLEKYLNDF